MKTYDITDIIENIHRTVETHKIDDGVYSRWLWQNEAHDREMGVNPYGCADAANILYTIGAFPSDPAEREKWIKTLQNMQWEDGLFHEVTHYRLHTTAHCLAALELFDAKPLKKCEALSEYLDYDNFEELMNGLNWSGNPWTDSHIGAGIYVALNLSGMADRKWNDNYFKWFWDNTDPDTGMWMNPRSIEIERKAPLYSYMAGSFHYLFNHEYAHMPLRYPEKMIDSCISMYEEQGLPHFFGKSANFIEADWIYCLTRAQRQTPHRFYEVRKCLEDFTEKYLEFWYNVDWDTHDAVNDLHMLFGGVCALAELQQTLKGKILSDKPLKLVLDRRPFI